MSWEELFTSVYNKSYSDKLKLIKEKSIEILEVCLKNGLETIDASEIVKDFYAYFSCSDERVRVEEYEAYRDIFGFDGAHEEFFRLVKKRASDEVCNTTIYDASFKYKEIKLAAVVMGIAIASVDLEYNQLEIDSIAEIYNIGL